MKERAEKKKKKCIMCLRRKVDWDILLVGEVGAKTLTYFKMEFYQFMSDIW